MSTLSHPSLLVRSLCLVPFRQFVDLVVCRQSAQAPLLSGASVSQLRVVDERMSPQWTSHAARLGSSDMASHSSRRRLATSAAVLVGG
jgi:hypothetical protein